MHRGATGAAQAAVSPVPLQSEGSGLCVLRVYHEAVVLTFLTASEQSRSLCVFGSERYRVRADETQLVRLILECDGGLSNGSWSYLVSSVVHFTYNLLFVILYILCNIFCTIQAVYSSHE